MDSIEITTELNKINRIHQSLNETNPITYIIFQETFRDKLTDRQHEWLDYKVTDLNHKLNMNFHQQMSNYDMGLMMAPILEKSEEFGTMRRV
jgi:hypothetical protein